jgi:hypothetical protein
MGAGEDFQFNGFSGDSKHPQFPTIKKHIERAVQDLFLDSLRNKSNDLLYVFGDEKQIDGFVERILNYWEGLEDYEVCKEVLELTGDFKQRWQERESLGDSSALIRIRELFKPQE